MDQRSKRVYSPPVGTSVASGSDRAKRRCRVAVSRYVSEGNNSTGGELVRSTSLLHNDRMGRIEHE